MRLKRLFYALRAGLAARWVRRRAAGQAAVRAASWLLAGVVVAVAAVIASLAALRWATGPIPIHMMVATILGVFVTVMLGAGLMGLVFLSSGTGYDDKIDDRSRPDDID